MRLPWSKPKAYSDVSGLDATTARIWEAAFGGITAKSGQKVDANTALFSNAITACIAVRSRTLSSLPVHVYRVGTRQRADEHPTSVLFRGGPNEYMTWSQFVKLREMMLILTGNFYARKQFKGGRVVGLEPLYGVTRPVIRDDSLMYVFDPEIGPREVLAPAELIHFKWDVLTADGMRGRSVVELAREAIGLDISAEEFLGRVLSNGTHMGTVLTTDNVLAPDQIEQLALQLQDGRGVAPAGKARIFQNGLKPMVLGMNTAEADLENQRRFVNEKIAALCGVPLSLLNDMTHATYSNVEQMDLGYSKHHILPAVVELEQTLTKGLFGGLDQGRYYVRMSLQGLERGDFLTRMQGYETGIRVGMWSPNECREWEDMDPYPEGDIRVMQAQMTPIEDLGLEPAQALAPVVADAQDRIRIRARIDAEKKREPSETREWARAILAPIASAHSIAGLDFDTEAVITSAIGS